MTEKDKYRIKEQEEEQQSTKEPDEGTTDPTGRYATPTREDIAAGNFADPFAPTDQQDRRQRDDDQQGGQQDESTGGAGTSSSSDSGGGGQRSTEEILQGVQDETQVADQTEGVMESPLEQETFADRLDAAGLLPDYSAPGMDELAAAADETGAPGLPTGKEGISDTVSQWKLLPDGEIIDQIDQVPIEEGTQWPPGENEIFETWETIGPGGGNVTASRGKNSEWGEFTQYEYEGTTFYDFDDGTRVQRSEDQPSGEDAGQQDRPESQSTPDPEPVLGDATDVTKAWNDFWGGGESDSSSGSGSGSSSSGGAAGGGAGQPDPEGGMTPEEWAQHRASYDALFPPELRTDSILQNATGRGPSGGETVNPGREGGTEYGVSTGEATGAQDQQQSMVGNPGTDESSSGTKSGSTSGGDQGGYTDPTDDALSSGEMGLTEDNPLDAQPSDASSLLENGDDEGGYSFTKGNFSAEQLQAAQWMLYESEEDTADDTYDDFGI